MRLQCASRRRAARTGRIGFNGIDGLAPSLVGGESVQQVEAGSLNWSRAINPESKGGRGHVRQRASIHRRRRHRSLRSRATCSSRRACDRSSRQISMRQRAPVGVESSVSSGRDRSAIVAPSLAQDGHLETLTTGSFLASQPDREALPLTSNALGQVFPPILHGRSVDPNATRPVQNLSSFRDLSAQSCEVTE